MQVNSVTAPYGQTAAVTEQPVKTLDKDAFLQLFVEQLKHQDPMSPQDANSFMAQMAQFSVLEQITNISNDIGKLRLSQEMGEAAALLGKLVTVQTTEGAVAGPVEKVTLVEDKVQLYIDGASYELAQVTAIEDQTQIEEEMLVEEQTQIEEEMLIEEEAQENEKQINSLVEPSL